MKLNFNEDFTSEYNDIEPYEMRVKDYIALFTFHLDREKGEFSVKIDD